MTDTVYSRTNPFPARLLANRSLTGMRPGKDTRHYEVTLEDSGLQYECGDSIGIYGTNDPALVDEILTHLGFSGEEIVEGSDKSQVFIREALSTHYTITQPDKKFLKEIVERADAAPLLTELLHPDRRMDLMEYLWGLEIIDFLRQHPSVRFTPQEFVGTLRKLLPRLYSVASSQNVVGEAVHFTMATVRYESNGRARKGVCTTWFADRLDAQTPIPVFVHTARSFHLPEDHSIPIIMVGPGTGVAPFRAFMQEREAAGATGKNWLFFGEQYEATDFLYRDEFENWLRKGTLTRLHTAFSRDQAHKIYVQDRIRENAKEIWQWLEEGAYFYVCGDAAHMAKDVDTALREIIAKEGSKSEDEVGVYMEMLKKEKRYRRDVY